MHASVYFPNNLYCVRYHQTADNGQISLCINYKAAQQAGRTKRSELADLLAGP